MVGKRRSNQSERDAQQGGNPKESNGTLSLLLEKIGQLEAQKSGRKDKASDPVEARLAAIDAKARKEAAEDEEQANDCELDGVLSDPGAPLEQRLQAATAIAEQQAQTLERWERDAARMADGCRALAAQARVLPEQATLLRREAQKKAAVKEKLEELCRAFSQQIKALKAQTASTAEEERKRCDAHRKSFDDMLAGIRTRMEDSNKERERQAKENSELEEKLKGLGEYRQAKRELQEGKRRQAELDVLQAQQRIAEASRVLLAAKEQEELADQIHRHKMEGIEATRRQVEAYKLKAGDIDAALRDSARVHAAVQERAEEMKKTAADMEAENLALKRALEESAQDLTTGTEELKSAKRELEVALATKVRLEKACRALQVERMERRERLKASQE